MARAASPAQRGADAKPDVIRAKRGIQVLRVGWETQIPRRFAPRNDKRMSCNLSCASEAVALIASFSNRRLLLCGFLLGIFVNSAARFSA
jgi:hypothetical protein